MTDSLQSPYQAQQWWIRSNRGNLPARMVNRCFEISGRTQPGREIPESSCLTVCHRAAARQPIGSARAAGSRSAKQRRADTHSHTGKVGRGPVEMRANAAAPDVLNSG